MRTAGSFPGDVQVLLRQIESRPHLTTDHPALGTFIRVVLSQSCVCSVST